MSAEQTKVCWPLLWVYLRLVGAQHFSSVAGDKTAWQDHTDNGHKLKYRKSHLNIRKSCFIMKMTKHWSRLLRDFVESWPFWDTQSPAGQCPVQAAYTDPALAGGWMRWSAEGSSNLSHFVLPRAQCIHHPQAFSRLISFDWQPNGKGKATLVLAILSQTIVLFYHDKTIKLKEHLSCKYGLREVLIQSHCDSKQFDPRHRPDLTEHSGKNVIPV